MDVQRNNQEFMPDNSAQWIYSEGYKVHLIGLNSLFVEFCLVDRTPTIETACKMLERMRIYNNTPNGSCEAFAFALLHAYERFLLSQNSI